MSIAKKVFIHKPTLPDNTDILFKWASSKSVEIVELDNVKRTSEFLQLAKEHNPFAIVNTFGLSPGGGWTDELVQSLPSSVKAITNFGAGYDGLGDLSRFRAKDIQVSNTPTGVAQATADTGLFLILATLRNYSQLLFNLKEGNFSDGVSLADEYDGKTLGILGLGGVGSHLRDKVVGAFDFAKIQYHNRHRAPSDVEKGAVYVSFEELLATSDVIVLILPLNSSTRHIINKETISKTKKGAIIINIGRGPLIDEQALIGGLESGQIKSVGLDVYENEPEIDPKLLAFKNTVLLPHAGTHTTVARTKMLQEVIDNLDSVLETGNVINLVPELRK